LAGEDPFEEDDFTYGNKIGEDGTAEHG